MIKDTNYDVFFYFQSVVRSPSPARKFEMATVATAGGRLAQETHDEFLVCKICLEGYTNPNCLHTFCEQCIENHVMSESTYKKYSDYREFTCLLCRKRTQLPIGGVKKLPDNFLVQNLSETVGRQKPSKYPFCDFCKMVHRKHREAASKCLDCAKLLCKECVELHRETRVTGGHSIFDVEIEKDIECKEHSEEVVRFYCEPCETCICVLYTFNEHKDHEISQFGDAVVKYKENIQKMLKGCNDKIDKFDNQIMALDACEDVYQNAKQSIQDAAIKFIADVRAKEKLLLEELKNIFGKDTMEYIENKKDLAATVDGLRSTCNLTEIILKGKDIELLLLKKDVQDKLTSFGSVEIRNLPTTINKQVTFNIGNLDLGYLEDSDRPLLSKMRTPRYGSQMNGNDNQFAPVLKDMGCQTERHTKKITEQETESEEESDDDDEDSDEESGSESGDSEEESDESDDETEPVEMCDKSIQTEGGENDLRSTKLATEMRDKQIGTDNVITEEKAVNTRSRSLQSLACKEGNTGSGSTGSLDEPENSLAARRRPLRERAHTTTVNSIDNGQISPDINYNRKQRSKYLYTNHSVEG